MPPEALQKLKEKLTAIDNAVTIEELKKAVEAMLTFSVKLQTKTETELTAIKTAVDSAISRIQTLAKEESTEAKQEIMDSCDSMMNEMRLTHEAMMAECDAKMTGMKDGENGMDGQDADEEAMLVKLEAKIPPRMTAIEIRDALESIQPEDEQLNIEAIRGLKEILTKLEEKIGGRTTIIGGNHPLSNLPDVNASGISDGQVLAWSASLGRWEATTPSGGSGFTQLSATETPDGAITVFTFAAASAQPSFIIVDNVWMKATTKSGAVNWTWNAGAKQATLTIPPNEDIVGVV